MVFLGRALVAVVLTLVAFEVLSMREANPQDPQQPSGEQPAEYRPNPPFDPSRVPGIDPVGQMILQDRQRMSSIESRLDYALNVIRVQQRQIHQLQRIVFGIGARGRGVAPGGQEPIGAAPEHDAGVEILRDEAEPISQSPDESEGSNE